MRAATGANMRKSIPRASCTTLTRALMILGIVLMAAPIGKSVHAGEMMRMTDQEMRLRMLLKAVDANSDGQISREEYVQFYVNTYDRIDMEKKGVLSHEEMEENMQQLHMLDAR